MINNYKRRDSFQTIFFLVVCVVAVCIYCPVNGQSRLTTQNLEVLDSPAKNMMRSYLTNFVDNQFAVRDSILSTLKTAKDWDHRIRTIRDSLVSWTGPFPKRTPLNPRITGRVKHKQYTIEKIIFDSRLNFPVSANLYLPKNVTFPRPTILNVIGHRIVGKSSKNAQIRSIVEVKKGFVVLTIDAIGQGERKIGDYGLKSPGQAHKILGLQAFLSGTHLFNFMAWDVIRAIDYLVGRPEVNATKIGITGESGGGMMSTYILPFDNRIAIAVPVCNPNTWSFRVHANLGTDEEQVFPGAFASAIDPRGDPLFVFAHAKKPLLLNTTTDDHLNPPRGVWALSTWLFRAYSSYSFPERFTTCMTHGVHGYNKEQREINNSWMLRWTGGNSSKYIEQEKDTTLIVDKQSLWASRTGSVYDTPGSREPWDLILDYLGEHKAKWNPVKTKRELSIRKVKIKNLVKNTLYQEFDNIKVKSESKGIDQSGKITIHKFILEPEKGIELPVILLKSKTTETANSKHQVILYISSNGKTDILKEKSTLKTLLKKGRLICAVDLRGIGETAPSMQHKLWDILIGKPIFGQRVYDVLATTKWLQNSVNAKRITLWGKGMGAIYGAFAGLFNNNITKFVLENPLLSFESVIRTKIPKYTEEVLVPNILKGFDMPQIYQCLCPRSVTILNPYLGDKTVADSAIIRNEFKSVTEIYKKLGKSLNWNVQTKGLKGARSSIILKSLAKGE